MASQTKSEFVEELGSQTTKADLVELLGKNLEKEELASLLEDESGASKDELLQKLKSKPKDDLVQAVEQHLSKDEIRKVVDERRPEPDEADDEEPDEPRSERSARGQTRRNGGDAGAEIDDSTDIDWSAELAWAPPPRPTPAPVTFTGPAPFQPGQRVRIDISGLPMMGVFAGRGATAAGTITGVDAQARMVRVYLDAVMDGHKEMLVPPERITPDP